VRLSPPCKPAAVAVHSPLEAPQARIDALSLRAPDPKRNIFAAMVSELDDGVGRVMSALSSVGMAENTLTIFSTDNGVSPACPLSHTRPFLLDLCGIHRRILQGGVCVTEHGAIAGPCRRI
jgi:arylsulfatase A-like enzyme